MAGHEEEDYMRDVDTHETEGFVAGGVQDLDDLELADHEVTYRRADFGTSFLTSRFDALEQAEFSTQNNKPTTSVQFATVTHSHSGLDDDDDDDDDDDHATFHPALITVTSASSSATTTTEQHVLPTGDVPDARAVGYHCVNPSFESETPAPEILTTLLTALKTHDITSTTRADWTIEAFALVAAEEVYFTIQLHRLPTRSIIRVDFNLSDGDEMLFLATTDKILKDCRAIDRDMQHLPDLSFDFLLDWSQPHAELFPTSLPIDERSLQLLLDDVQNAHSHPATRYEAAKSLKNLCQVQRNRTAVATAFKQQFIVGLDAMLQDDNEDIVRFAIFAIQTFEADASLRSHLEFPELSDKLRTISSSSTKSSTKQLADDLLRAIVSPIC